jgi:probable phosphoglycerate mutase
MHLYLIRHADPVYTIDSLSTQGQREAEALALRLKEIGIHEVYCSPAGRCRKTADILKKHLKIEYTILDWLREPANIRVYQGEGDYPVWDVYGESVRSGDTLPDNDDWLEYTPFQQAELKKAWIEFRTRTDEFCVQYGYERRGYRYGRKAPNRKRIALIAHTGTVLLFLCNFLELPPPLVFTGFFIWPSSITTIFFEERSQEWAVPRALCVSDTSHLYRAGLIPQARGMGGRCDEIC